MFQVHCKNIGKNIKIQYTYHKSKSVTKIDIYRNILEGNIQQDIKTE